MAETDPQKPVLVTGASGYIASWIVKELLEKGRTVHGTVRDASDEAKVAHLRKLEAETPGTLRLFEADLLEDGAFAEAMSGCEWVIHTASPFRLNVKDPQKELVEPALRGTRNVLTTANETSSVRKVVLTSSVVAIYGDSIELQEKGGPFTEEDWNESSSLNHQPYSYSKTVAEREAWNIAKKQDRWELAVINPSFVLGPSLSDRTDSTSTDFMINLAGGKLKSGVPDIRFGIVDVRDVALAHIRAGERPEARGRHIVSGDERSLLEMADILREHFDGELPLPGRTLPKWLVYLFGPLQGFSWKYVRRNIGYPLQFDNTRSRQQLGLDYRSVKTTLVDQVEQMRKSGLISLGRASGGLTA